MAASVMLLAGGWRMEPAPPSQEDCRAAAREVVGQAQDFIDEYADVTVDEWNALDPSPSIAAVERTIDERVQALIERGCVPLFVLLEVSAAIARLRGEGEVGQEIAEVLRGDEPSATRQSTASQRAVEPGDDVAAILATVGSGSRVTFAAGDYPLTDTIVVDASVELVGAGQGETTISSSAPGLAFAFIGPGDLSLSDLSLRHTGTDEASVLLAIEGGITLRRVAITGGVAAEEEAGHGVIFAFENLPDLPPRSAEERAGELVVEDATVTGNAGAGIVVTGDAAPRITGSTIADNGRCGVCYSGMAAGTLATSTIEDNGEIGVQVVGSSHPTIDRSTVRGHEVGVLVGGSSTAEVTDTAIEDSEVAIRALDTAHVVARGNTISTAAVAGVSVVDSAAGTLLHNHIDTEAQVAIEIAGAASADVHHNVVEGAGEVGVSFIEEASGRATFNVVTRRNVGIQVGGTAAPVLFGNHVRNSGLVGIVFDEDAAGSAISNFVTQLVGSTVQVGGSSHPQVIANDLRGGQYGIVYVDTAGGTATHNRIVDHRVGVEVAGTAVPRLVINEFGGIELAAIVFAETSAGEATGNVCGEGSGAVIAVFNTATPTVGENDCETVEAE